MQYPNNLVDHAGKLRAKFQTYVKVRRALTECLRDAAHYLDPITHYDLVSFIACGLFVGEPDKENAWLAAVSEERLTPDEVENEQKYGKED